MTLAAVPLPNIFPDLAIPTEDEVWTTIARKPLREALEFLSQRPGKKDPWDPSQKCIFCPDGIGITGMSGFGVLLFKGPWPSFGLSLSKHDARRLLAWIKRYERIAGNQPDELRIATFDHAGLTHYCLGDPEGRHRVCFPATSGSSLRDRLQYCHNSPITLEGNVRRRHLKAVALLAEKTALDESLTFTFGVDGNHGFLDVLSSQATAMRLQDRLRLEVVGDLPPASPVVTFGVAGRRLREALDRVSGDSIRICYRAGSKALSLRKAPLNEEGAVAVQTGEVIMLLASAVREAARGERPTDQQISREHQSSDTAQGQLLRQAEAVPRRSVPEEPAAETAEQAQ